MVARIAEAMGDMANKQTVPITIPTLGKADIPISSMRRMSITMTNNTSNLTKSLIGNHTNITAMAIHLNSTNSDLSHLKAAIRTSMTNASTIKEMEECYKVMQMSGRGDQRTGTDHPICHWTRDQDQNVSEYYPVLLLKAIEYRL